MEDSKEVKIVPIGEGAAHLQNVVPIKKICYICHKAITEESVLMRKTLGKKEMVFVCTNHSGVVQEFIRQFGRPPFKWRIVHADKDNSKKETGTDNPV